MTEKLTYKDLALPTFVNSHEAITVKSYGEKGKEKAISLDLSDAYKAAVLAGVPILNVGDTRIGKSAAMNDVHFNYFGGAADGGGKSNWHVGRNEFVAKGYFETIDQSKVGEGKGLLTESRQLVKPRIEALCNNVDEINHAVEPVQVEFFGIAEGRHEGTLLGKEGYHLFQASCNVNRVNGDFVGISQLDRALLNRFGVTFDHNHYGITDEDRDALAARKTSGRAKPVETRDISDKILQAYREISEAASQRDPWLDAYLRIFSSALDYCNESKSKKKRSVWPMNCSNCKFKHRDLCSLIKHSNQGTIETTKLFASGINYLIQLKHGKTEVDPFDLALEAFKFTTYHGNINGVERDASYEGEDQDLMEDAVHKIREKINPIRKYMDMLIERVVSGHAPETRFIRLNPGTPNEIADVYSEGLEKTIKEKEKEKKIKYDVFDPFDDKEFSSNNGLRIDWFKGYLNSLHKHYNGSKEAEREN